MSAAIPLVDLRAQYAAIREGVRAAMDDVLESGTFVLSEVVARFEQSAAEYFGAAHAVGVGSGFDALRLALVATGVGPGDEVILPANTYAATALAVSAAGAHPVLVDCRADTFAIDTRLVPAAISARTRAIIPVHLYGQAADMTAVMAVARAHGLRVIEDAAQAHGARFLGQACGTFGVAGCFSFYPSKNLGAYGDGGLVLTNDVSVAEQVRQLRHYGQRARHDHAVLGGNSRLDSLQAAVLGVKLRYLDEWNALRARHAARYCSRLAEAGVDLPARDLRASHVYHLFVVRSPNRDALQTHLASLDIETAVHYPVPVHLMTAYRHLGYRAGAFPEAERASREVLSLPMYPELTDSQIGQVAEAVAEAAEAARARRP